MQPGSRDSRKDEASILKHMTELHACAEVQPRRGGHAVANKIFADHHRPVPKQGQLLVPHNRAMHTLARDCCGWQWRSSQRYDGYNFVLSKEPVCSEWLNEGSFACAA